MSECMNSSAGVKDSNEPLHKQIAGSFVARNSTHCQLSRSSGQQISIQRSINTVSVSCFPWTIGARHACSGMPVEQGKTCSINVNMEEAAQHTNVWRQYYTFTQQIAAGHHDILFRNAP
eukprot:2548937-Amphidinium_carterae.1